MFFLQPSPKHDSRRPIGRGEASQRVILVSARGASMSLKFHQCIDCNSNCHDRARQRHRSGWRTSYPAGLNIGTCRQRACMHFNALVPWHARNLLLHAVLRADFTIVVGRNENSWTHDRSIGNAKAARRRHASCPSPIHASGDAYLHPPIDHIIYDITITIQREVPESLVLTRQSSALKRLTGWTQQCVDYRRSVLQRPS